MTSILISGIDLVGKTTLLHNLSNALQQQGFDVTENDHELVKTHLSRKVLELMINDPRIHEKGEEGRNHSLEINAMLAMNMIIDSVFYQLPPEKIVIQDSYWQRIVAFNKVNKLPYIAEVLASHARKRMLFAFDINLMLTASIEVKRERYKTKKDVDSIDEQVFTNSDLVVKFEQELERIMEKEPNYFKIETTPLTPEQVTKEAIKYIIPRIKQGG